MPTICDFEFDTEAGKALGAYAPGTLPDLDTDPGLSAAQISTGVAGVVDQASGPNWTLYQGDACEVIKGIPDNSIDFGVHSPPFSNLYIYSDSEADMGNSVNDEEFFAHYKFLIRELLRVTVVGRCCAIHVKDLPKYANRDDTAGLIDFPGECIRSFIECGWSFHSRVTIWKCPVTERERTNNNGLLYKTATRDRSQLRQGMADYLLVFRKAPPDGKLPGPKPIASSKPFDHYNGDQAGDSPLTKPKDQNNHPSPFARKKPSDDPGIDIWRRYAEPVWWDINQTDVLQFKDGTDPDDERHICPLQLSLIRRAVQIWSAPGDVVLSPFAGIGSEGWGSIMEERKFIGIELKPSYWRVACRNLGAATETMRAGRLF